jgi:chromosome segregation ATPase
MIEPIMYVGIGFLVAGLLIIGLIPLVHARAVRLTMKRLEAVTPMSMAEIQADKDQLRAEFAMATRRLEMSVEQMKAKTMSQLAEIGKKGDAIGRLKLELSEKSATLLALEAKEQELQEDARDARQELVTRTATQQEAERALTETVAELAKVSTDLKDVSLTNDNRHVELMALGAQVEVLKGRVESYEKETQELHEQLIKVTSEAKSANEQLVEERARNESLDSRVGELDRGLVAQKTETEILNRRVTELLAQIEVQARALGANDKMRDTATFAKKTEADLRAELAEAANRVQVATESVRAEKTLLEEQLKRAHEERDRLKSEIEAAKQQVESAWGTERMENAVLRERINDVAAEVAKLTSLVEGPGSPIEAILADEAGRAHAASNGTSNGNGNGALAGEASKGTLADRIRALQSHASRLPAAG